MKFDFESPSTGVVKMKISGRIDEMSVFPKFEGQSISRLCLNLEDVDGINSMGILFWIRWWKDLLARNSGLTFEVEQARMNIIACSSVVAGFLPEKTEIKSFYLTYHNEIEGQSIQELQQKGINYDDKKITVQEEITRPYEGKEQVFELDCFPNRDLRCLNLEIELV